MKLNLNNQPTPSGSGGLPVLGGTINPQENNVPTAPPDPANSINLRPGLLTGEADVAQLEKK